MRTCIRCGGPLAKSGNESRYQFAARRYCSRECVNAAKLARTEARRTDEQMKIDQKVRTMGSTRVTNATLDADRVRMIRELHTPLGFNAREIAEMYGLTQGMVAKVIQGITWRHIV